MVLISEGAQRVRADALRMPLPTHKALTKLEPLWPTATAQADANGDEPAPADFKSGHNFEVLPTCICLKSHEENALPTQLTNFLIKQRIATWSYEQVDANEPSTEVVRILFHASEALLGQPAVLHTKEQPADWHKQPVLFDAELQPGKYGSEQQVRAAFNCNFPLLQTYHMTPGILVELLKQLDSVQPSSVIGHFGRQRDTGVWVAHNNVALRRDDDGGVSTESHAAVGVAMLMSAIQKLNRNQTLVMPGLATVPAPWLRYELFYRMYSGNSRELPSLLYDAFTCNLMSSKCALASALLFLHTRALRNGHLNSVSGPPVLWLHGEPLTGKTKTAGLLGALFGLQNSGGASSAPAIYDRLSQVADAPVVVDDIEPNTKFLNDVTRHAHDGLPRSVSGKMTQMRAGLVLTSNGVPDRTADPAMLSRMLLLPFATQRLEDLDADSAGLLNGAPMRELLSSLLQDFDSIRWKGELDAQAIEECTLYLQLAVGDKFMRRGLNLWGCALYAMLVLERASQCAGADLARVIDWVVEQAAGEAHASTMHAGLLRRFVVALGLVAPFGWGRTNAASQARACSCISVHNAVECVRPDGAHCYAVQLESACAAIQQQLNQTFDASELRQAVRRLKLGDPLQRDLGEGRVHFYDANAGAFPPIERETGRYLTQQEALANCHIVQSCVTITKQFFNSVRVQCQGNAVATGDWRAVAIDAHGTKQTGSRFPDVAERYNFYEDAQRPNALIYRALGECNYKDYCGPGNLYNVEQPDADVARRTAAWLAAKGLPATTDLLQPQPMCAQLRKGWDADPPPCYESPPKLFQYAAPPEASRSATPPPSNGPRSPPESPEEQPPRSRTRYDEGEFAFMQELEGLGDLDTYFNQDYETTGNCTQCGVATVGGTQLCLECTHP